MGEYGYGRRRAFVYSKNVVTLSLTDLIGKWPKECRENDLKRHAGLNASVSCVSMLAHPIGSDGVMNVKRIIEIMCVDPGYTVYKSDPEGGEEWNLACTDTYDLAGEICEQVADDSKYRKVKVSRVSFTNERAAHEAVATDLQKVLSGRKKECDWYDNSHGIIDEFVLKTSSMPCGGCIDGISGRLFDGTNPLCVRCRPTNRFEGVTVNTPKVIDLSMLRTTTNMTNNNNRAFTRASMIHEELVTFTSPDRLPFVKGDPAIDERYTKQFLDACKSVVYDIETVTVDDTLVKRIPDEVVTITASLNTGTTTDKMVMFTRRIPVGWKDKMATNGDTIDPNELLGNLRKPDQKPLPPMRVMVFSTEGELVEAFKDFLIAYKPHFLVSFNGHGFDNKFLVRASISNRLKETFHGALNHFTPAVKIGNINPLKTTAPQQFMRPYGRHCKGLIPDSVMEVSYNSFPCMLSIDLFLIHDTSLNDACAAKKVDGCKLEGVSHTDIPRLYYGRHPDFFKYAVLDVVITTDLYWKDRFDAVELFIELEELVSTPWNMSVSRQKTMTAQTTTYIQFHTNGFIREAKLRPKRALAEAVVDDMAKCLADKTREPMLDETLQILTDFVNGNCKCNTVFKKLPRISSQEPLTKETVKKVLFVYGRSCRKATDPPFSTVDALMLMFYMLRGEIDWRPFEELLGEFSIKVGGDPKKVTGLRNYLMYVVRTRRRRSHFSETGELMWKEYRKNHKPDTVVTQLLATFVKNNHLGILSAAGDSTEYPRSMSPGFTVAHMVGLVKELAGGEGIKIKMLPYDGAMIIFNSADINLTNPICCLDFRSQYPNGMRAINLGIDTNVSLTKVLECVDLVAEKRGIEDRREAARALSDEFVHVCFTREEDDEVDWTRYLDYPEYLSDNCVFFVKNTISIQNHQFEKEIASRVEDKFRSEDPNLTKEERLKFLNRSTAKKVNINSRYGVIQSTINPRFQATVTGVGRRSIQKVTKQLKELLGTVDIYGDSVPGYTPVVLRDEEGMVFTTTFSELMSGERWFVRPDGKEEIVSNGTLQVRTHDGWQDVMRVIRHKTDKRIYRVSTPRGVVDVTEDHSLLTPELDTIPPGELVPGVTKLLHLAGKAEAVTEVTVVHDVYAGYVYDLETASGSFNAGVGDIVLKNTDSCFTSVEGLNVFDMADMPPKVMYDRLSFTKFDVTFETFKETIYDKHYPVNKTSPRAIREAGGGVVQKLYEAVAPILSTEALELEAEKTLCPMILPTMKKYSAYNCVTRKVMTKGLSMHNKSAIAMTRKILATFVDMAVDCWDEYELVSTLYDYLGKMVTVPIEEGLVDPADIAKPCSISINKLKPNTKQNTLMESMTRDGVTFIFEKVRVKQVPIYPEGVDKDWSLCDVMTQKCDGRVHVVKSKYDVLKEILTILRGKYSQGVCGLAEALIWGEFYPDAYTAEGFRKLSAGNPAAYKPSSFGKIVAKCIPADELLRTKKTKTTTSKKLPIRPKSAPTKKSSSYLPEKCVPIRPPVAPTVEEEPVVAIAKEDISIKTPMEAFWAQIDTTQNNRDNPLKRKAAASKKSTKEPPEKIQRYNDFWRRAGFPVDSFLSLEKIYAQKTAAGKP
jgi:hypothetical protein